METGSSSTPHQDSNEIFSSGEKLKPSNPQKVPINRIRGLANGKTCHQCRQKKMYFAAACKNLKKGKPFTIKYCCSCLLNWYGENEEEVAQLGDWICIKCRNLCNCNVCRKKEVKKPTGKLIDKARELGFKCVSEMLSVMPPEAFDSNSDIDAALASKEENLKKEQKLVDNSSSDKVLTSKAVSPIKQIKLESLDKEQNHVDNSSSDNVLTSKAVSPIKQIKLDKEQKLVDNSSSDKVLTSKAVSPIKQIESDKCRQKMKNFSVTCKNLKKGKPCPIKFCCKCPLNRYGKIAKEVVLLVDWKCPKCRSLCICSVWERKRGNQPTGCQIHTAEATTSGYLVSNKENDIAVLPSKEAILEKELVFGPQNAQKELLPNMPDNTNPEPEESKGWCRKKKRVKRLKIFKEVPREEDRGCENGNHNKVSEEKLDGNLDNTGVWLTYPEAWVANDFSSNINKLIEKDIKDRHVRVQTQVHRNDYSIFGDHVNGFLGPADFGSTTLFLQFFVS